MVAVGADVLSQYPRFTLYNSPYRAHRRGRAIDLYPSVDHAPSPVAGTVERSRRVACPDRPYAADHDHLLVIDTGSRLARVLHVDPAVAVGERVAVGQDLGELIRSGYFAPWVDNHLHLGFRRPGDDPLRASGSLPVTPDVPIEAVPWDGTGRVVETGDTYAVLDRPTHPRPGATYAAIADDSGDRALDGGLAHYEGGGSFCVGTNGARPSLVRTNAFGGEAGSDPSRDISNGSDRDRSGDADHSTPEGSTPERSTQERSTPVGETPVDETPVGETPVGETPGGDSPHASDPEPVRLLGTVVGERDGRDVAWGPVTVQANGQEIAGLSFVFGLNRCAAKLICPETHFEVGESVSVQIVRAGERSGPR